MDFLRDIRDGLANKVEILIDNFKQNNLLSLESPLENVIGEICKIWKIDKTGFIPTSLLVLSVLLEDPANHDVSNLLHRLLSVNPETVLNAFTAMYEQNFGENQLPEQNLREDQPPGQRKVTPKSLPELCKIMKAAAKNRQKIKAVSTNYSGLWTDIGSSTGIIIDTSRLKGDLPNECLLDSVDGNDYYNFLAGNTMNEIQEKLWPLAERGTEEPWNHRVLENVTSGAGLSLAGTVSTGAHGNGLKLGNVADAVVSFQMVTIDLEWRVKRYQIERESDPITDCVKFKNTNPGNQNNDYLELELIQNDEVFNASVVNIGCMGVVYSYVLRTVKGFCLKEERRLCKWSEAKNEIRNLYVNPNIYNFQIIGSPYAYKLSSRETAEHHVLISILSRADPPGGIRQRGRHLNLPMEYLNKALVAVGDSTPHLVPVVMHFSLLYMRHEGIVLNAVEALNTLDGIVSTTFSGVRTSECAMRSSGAETVIEIMEDLHKLYSDIRRSNDRQLVNVPIALRFTSKSNYYMAMEYDCHRPTITIEQSIINGTLGADDTLRKFRKRMLKKFQGRPHWGMLHEMDAEKLKRLYDANCRQKFNLALKRFDPNRVFENEFADWVFGKERRK